MRSLYTTATPSAISCYTLSEVSSPSTSSTSPRFAHRTIPRSGGLNPLAPRDAPPSLSIPSFELFSLWSDYFVEQKEASSKQIQNESLAYYMELTREFLENQDPLLHYPAIPSELLLMPWFASGNLMHGLAEALQCWIGIGADVNFRYSEGMTALSWMLHSRNFGIWSYFQMLIAHGADTHEVVPMEAGAGLLHQTLSTLAALPQAAYYADEFETRLIVLLEAGCNRNMRDSKGRTPPECIPLGSGLVYVWERALERVEHRKTMNADEREKDLSRWPGYT
jgi:hypothetical protein